MHSNSLCRLISVSLLPRGFFFSDAYASSFFFFFWVVADRRVGSLFFQATFHSNTSGRVIARLVLEASCDLIHSIVSGRFRRPGGGEDRKILRRVIVMRHCCRNISAEGGSDTNESIVL